MFSMKKKEEKKQGCDQFRFGQLNHACAKIFQISETSENRVNVINYN